jgi:hypothetical protein
VGGVRRVSATPLSSLLGARPTLESGMSKSLRLGVALALVLTVAGVVGYVAARHGADKQERSHEAAPAIAAKQSEAQLAGAN